MNINEIKNSMIPRKVKEICWKCESNIHCRNKGCAFRSLGNEYCNEVLLATQEYLEKDQEIARLNNTIDKAIEYIPKIIISGKSEHSFNEFAVDFQQTKEGRMLLDILKGSDSNDFHN